MPDDKDTQPLGKSESPESRDPLGIIGWTIGGKYRITGYIGGGGFGEVYEGYNENLAEQRLVVKFFKRVQEREKFDKEARILCLLDHPNISRVIDYLPDEGAVVVAYIDGKDGKKILRESGALPKNQFLNVSRALTSAAAYAHDQKIAHRDIKPDNILIDKNDHVYLIDFGIAKKLGGDATRTGYQALTPMIAAPERQQGDRDYNPFLSDIYEIGVTLFNFATNSLPYRNPVNPNVSDWGGEAAERLSPELRVILRKATHPDPSRRYQSATKLAQEFHNLDKVYTSEERKQKSGWLIAAVLVVTIIVVAFIGRDHIAGLFERDTVSETVTIKDKSTENGGTEKLENNHESAGNDTDDQKEGNKISGDVKGEGTKPATVQDRTTKTSEEVIKESVEESQVAQKDPPPPPPAQLAEVTISVSPSKDISIYMAGEKRTSGNPFRIKPGQYDLSVTHPDYPVYRQTIRVGESGRNLSVDLAHMAAAAGSVDIQLALAPPSDNQMLELVCNGRKQTITRFPVLGMEKSAGEWYVEMKLIQPGSSRQARIDSCVTFPYGGGSRYVLKGGEGFLRLDTKPGEIVTSVPVVIYWSEK